MVSFRALIWRAIGWSALLTRTLRRLAPNPFHFVSGKPLERWLLTYDLGYRSLALSNDPAIVENVMQDRAGMFPKSTALYALLRPLIGSGVFGQPGGAAVKDTRKLYSRALASIPDKTVAAVTRSVTERYIRRWLSSDAVERLPICTELSRMTVDIVALCTLGRTFDSDESERFAALFFEYHRRAVPLLLLLGDSRPDTSKRIVSHMELEAIGSAMRRLIHERFVAPLLDGEDDAGAAPFAENLRQAGFLQPTAERCPATTSTQPDERALDEIAVMLLAGHETTASVLSWLLWELAHRPTRQDEAARLLLAAQSGAAPARPSSERQSDEPIPADESLKALIKEALRLHPPIAFFLRDVRDDVVFREKPIARGSFMVIAPWTLHRHRKLWRQPDDFRPERWLGEGPACPRAAFIPFGMGPRTCPGAHFADIETREIMRILLQQCRFLPAMSDQPMPLGSLTSRPDREIYLNLSVREPSHSL